MTEAIKMRSTGERQESPWTNKMVDDLIRSIENFNKQYYKKD